MNIIGGDLVEVCNRQTETLNYLQHGFDKLNAPQRRFDFVEQARDDRNVKYQEVRMTKDDLGEVGIKTPKDINLDVAQALSPERYHLKKTKHEVSGIKDLVIECFYP